MISNRKSIFFILVVLLICAAMLTSHPRNKEFMCADTMNGQTLTSIQVYDGLPGEMASLAPDNENDFLNQVWTFTEASYQNEGYYLACFYGKNPIPTAIRLPESVKSCMRHGDFRTNNVNVVCKS